VNFGSVLWLVILLITFVFPVWKMKRVERLRLELISRLEKKRGTRVVTLVHRQEAISLLGIPIARFINIEDSEQVLRAIRLTPPDLPIDLILHTPGGIVLASEQIAMAMKRHRGKITVMVPHYAMSGGTMLALAAEQILMDENAVLGPVDPQVGPYPAASILAAVGRKPVKNLSDETLILADIAEKAAGQVRQALAHILSGKMDERQALELAELLTEGYWTHDYPLSVEDLKKMGLWVSVGLPEEVYRLMELYPQPDGRRPSVLYIPLPYRRENGGTGRE